MTSELLETIGQPAFLLEPDAEGNPIYVGVNDLWLGGVKLSADHALGQTAEQIFPGRFGSVAFEHHLTCMQDGKPRSYTVTLPMRGTLRAAQTNLRALRDEAGKVVQVIGTSQDISGQRIAEEAQTVTETMSHEMEEFVSLAAHDLRTPMRHVALLADMLREDFEDHGDGKLDLINDLEKVALKATELITDILSHAQTKAPSKPPEAISLDEMCRDIFMMLDPRNEHDFICDGHWVMADKTALQIVLRNLFDNAFKHCGRDNVLLTVAAAAAGQNCLEISICDNGNGFKDPAMAFLDGGQLKVDSGFGLLGVRRMIKARGGRITAQNLNDCKGSLIRFTLPGFVIPPQAKANQQIRAVI